MRTCQDTGCDTPGELALTQRTRLLFQKRGLPDVLSEGPPWSGLYGPVLRLIFINLTARSRKEYSERIFSGCPYLWRYHHPVFWPRGWSQELNGWTCKASSDTLPTHERVQTSPMWVRVVYVCAVVLYGTVLHAAIPRKRSHSFTCVTCVHHSVKTVKLVKAPAAFRLDAACNRTK